MEKTIELERKKILYTLRQSRRARGVRLCVASGGVFTVTAGPGVRESAIEKFIREKSDWVLRKLAYFSKFPRRLVVKNRRRHFAEHKERARAFVEERLKHFSQFYPHTKQSFGVRVYGFKWNKVAIRNQRSRWGSCSRGGNLNFNYKLALLPSRLADYIIVHELCHLGELNHSVKFWALVARILPEHRRLRKELRGMSITLN